MSEIVAHCHGGPLAGERRVVEDKEHFRPREVLRYYRGRGVYVRDPLSERGACFDWDPDETVLQH